MPITHSRPTDSDLARWFESIPESDIVESYGTSTTRYFCNAKPGTALSTGKWRIFRLTTDSNGNISKRWANGSTAYQFRADSQAYIEANYSFS